MKKQILVAVLTASWAGCRPETTQDRDSERVEEQQAQYEKAQPIPAFDWSLERHLLTQLYKIRNQKSATHSVWRSDRGMIEGDCPSYGYGIPYDSSLTNPLTITAMHSKEGIAAIEQPEPNGIFASKNTSATWVLCLNAAGVIEPVYVETKVTVYPGPVVVDYEKNRVTRSGDPTVTLEKE